MLPLVVIGADDSVRAAFEPWIGGDTPVLFYDTAEDAHHGLVDLAETDKPGWKPIAAAEDGRWPVTVVYGPKVFGLATTGQAVKLPHTGWSIVAASSIRDTQLQPRRVGADGSAAGEHANTMVFEAMSRLSAQFLVDADRASGDGSLSKLMELLGTDRFAQP